MVSYLKGLVFALLYTVASAAVLSSFTSVARAGDAPCDPPTVQVAGDQRRGDATQSASWDIVPGSSFRVVFSCAPGSASGLTSSDGLSKGSVSAGRESNGGPVTVGGDRLRLKLHGAEAVSFMGSTDPGSKIGDKKELSFFDGTGGTYKVTLRFIDAYASAGALGAVAKTANEASTTATHADAEAARAHQRIDDLPDSSSNGAADAAWTLFGGPLVLFRTNDFEAAGGLFGEFTYHFGPPQKIEPELAAYVAWSHGQLPVRPIVGVPLMIDEVPQDLGDFALLLQAGLPAAKWVSFALGAGPYVEVIHVPLATVGQQSNTHVWVYDSQTNVRGGALINLEVNFKPIQGLVLGLAEKITLPFVMTYATDGGEKDRYAAGFTTVLTLGGEVDVVPGSGSSSSTTVGAR